VPGDADGGRRGAGRLVNLGSATGHMPAHRAEGLGPEPGGYGTAAHRRPPEGDPAGAGRRAGCGGRVLSVASVLLAAAAVIVAMAVTDAGGARPPDDLAAAPVLLSNMADYGAMAKQAADALISADEHGARTTALAAGSNLKPMVNPFPDVRWNVFDPGEKNPPHHRWTKRRLRQEAARLFALVDEAAHWEDKKYARDVHATQKTSAWLAETLGNITKVEKMANAHMHTVYQGLKVAEAGIDRAIGTTNKMQESMDFNEDKKKRKVWEVLEEHRGKLDYNKVLQEQHDLLMKANIYKEENMDTVKVDRYDDAVMAAQDRVKGWIEGLRGRVGANISAFRQQGVDSVYRLGNFSAEEQEHADHAYERATTLRAESLRTATETEAYGRSVTELERNVSASQQGINGQAATAQDVIKGIDSLEENMNVTHASVAAQMRTLESDFEDAKERLAALVKSLHTVQSAMEEQQAAHSALVQEEDAEMEKLKRTASDLGPQIKSILDLSTNIAALKGETAKGIGTLTTRVSTLDAERNKTVLEEQKFVNDLTALRGAVDKEQAFADDDNTKTDYADLEAAVEPLTSKIAMVHRLSEDLSGIQGTMADSSKNITSQIAALEVGRKKWLDETTVLHKQLDTKVAAEIARQQGDITAGREALKAVDYLSPMACELACSLC